MRVVRNIIALLINQVGNWIITLILTIALPRYLGVNEFGLYSFALAFVGFFALGMKLGTGTYLSWRIPREPELAGRLTFNTLLLQLPLILVCSVVAIVVLPLLDPTPLLLHVMLLLLLATSISSLSATLSSGLTGLQIMKIPAFIMLGGAALDTGLVVAGMRFDISLVVIAALSALSEVAIFVVMAIYALPRLRLNFHVDPTLWRAILLGGMPFFAWSVVLLFYWQVDITMIKIMVPHDANVIIGWYAAASRLTNIPLFLPMIVIAPLLPALSAERNADSPKFRDMVSRSLRLVTLVALPAGVGVFILANEITELLNYPKGFEYVSTLLRILAFNVPLVAIDMILGTVLIAAARQRAWTIVGIVAGVFNPLVNLWAIPYTQNNPSIGNGAVGAAVVTVATELVMFIGALYLRPKGVFTHWDIWYVGRCLIAAGIMAPVVYFFVKAQVGLFPAIIYGAITYATVAYTLKLVRDDDILSLVSIVTSRVGVQLPFKGQTGTFARIPVVGANPSESLENPLHTTSEWAASAASSGWLAAASAPVLSSENWVNIIYSDDDLDETTLHETIPMHIAPSPAGESVPRLRSSGVR